MIGAVMIAAVRPFMRPVVRTMMRAVMAVPRRMVPIARVPIAGMHRSVVHRARMIPGAMFTKARMPHAVRWTKGGMMARTGQGTTLAAGRSLSVVASLSLISPHAASGAALPAAHVWVARLAGLLMALGRFAPQLMQLAQHLIQFPL
jgi:hypothetical protein